MPRHPAVATTVTAMRGGVFSTLAHRFAGLSGEIYPFHVGDTWMEPPPGARMEDLRVTELPGMHRYVEPHGYRPLLDAVAARRGVARDQVLIAAGATGGLQSVASAILEPGDEVLLLAPYWPLIRGIIQTARGVAIDVPFFDREGSVDALLRPFLTSKTAALYLNSPNNPTGRVLDGETIEAIAHFARANDLWLLSDEVYEDYAYARPHQSTAPFAPERTFTACSFSKAYGMAGNRVGYVIGPTAPVMLEVRKISTHSFYAAPTASQIAALRALEGGDPWVAEAKALYQRLGEQSAASLGLDAPEGGTFLFMDVSHLLDQRGLQGFLEDCLEDRLLLAPGPSFGAPYAGWVRLCFTAAPPEVTARGVAHLAARLGRANPALAHAPEGTWSARS